MFIGVVGNGTGFFLRFLTGGFRELFFLVNSFLFIQDGKVTLDFQLRITN
jgi:hypothetical protein